MPDSVSSEVNDKGLTVIARVKDKELNVLETYIINAKTGMGITTKGTTIDLSAYVTNPESKYYATLDKLNEMAKIDYEKRTGVASYISETALSEDGLSYRIQLTDADGNALEEYSVSPFTGYGDTSTGNAAELPQTGVTSPGTAAAAAGGLLLTLSGMFAVLKSGFLRKKEQE